MEILYSALGLLLYIIYGVATILAGLALASIRIVMGNETVVVLRYGKIIKVIGAGIYFYPVYIYTLVRYQTTIMQFNFIVRTAKTRDGKVKGYKDEKEVSQADVDIQCSLYTYFSLDNECLKQTYKFAPGNKARDLAPVIVPYVIDTIRSAAAAMPWPMLDRDRDKVGDYVLSSLIPKRPFYDVIEIDGVWQFSNELTTLDNEEQMESENPLVQFALDLKRTYLSLVNVDLSDRELAQALSEPEKKRLLGIAAEIESLYQKNAKINANKAAADARRRMVEAIKENPDLELLDALKEMAKGTSNTILFQLPNEIQSKLSEIMGGNDPLKGLERLSPEIKAEIVKLVTKK